MSIGALTVRDRSRTNSVNALRSRDILCFSHDWDGDPLSKTHLMRLLSRENRILWVNSIGYRAPAISRRDLRRAFEKLVSVTVLPREVEPNIHVLSPLAIPFQGEPLEIGFNPEFLRAGFEAIEDGDVLLKLISPLRPGLIEAADESRFQYLIMPIRLNV